MKTREELIDDLLTLAFAEDVGDGDATTLSQPSLPTNKVRSICLSRRRGFSPGSILPARCLRNSTQSLI